MPLAAVLVGTKSEHIDGAIRQGLPRADCDQRSLRGGLPANPYSMRGAFGFDCNSLHTIEADVEHAAPSHKCPSVGGLSIRRLDAWWLQTTGFHGGHAKGLATRIILKRDRRNHKQVHRRDAVSVITEKCIPSLGRRSPAPRHILDHGSLPDIDAKLEEFAVDPRSVPERVGNADVADQRPDV